MVVRFCPYHVTHVLCALPVQILDVIADKIPNQDLVPSDDDLRRIKSMIDRKGQGGGTGGFMGRK